MKDATLFSLYSICPIIEKHEDILEGLEPLLNEHVLSELDSKELFLKARALLCYNEITTRMFLEQQESTHKYCELLCQNLSSDEPLNIKVYALSCIRRM